MEQKHILALALIAVLAGIMLYSVSSPSGTSVAAVSDAFKGVFARTPQAHLVLWLPFNEGEGTVAQDESRNSNHGELFGDPAWVAGVGNSALSFDGVDDFVSIPHNSSYEVTSRFTLSTWVRIPEEGGGPVVSRGSSEDVQGSRLLLSVNKDEVRFVSGNAEVSASITLPENEWLHVAVTHFGAGSPNTTMYLDGIEAVRGDINAPALLARPLLVGYDAARERFFKGTLDEFRLYKRQLSEREIAELYLAEWPQE